MNMRSSYSEMVHVQGTEVQLSFLGVLWALSERENAVDIYNGEVESEEGTGIKTPPKQLIQQGEMTNDLCSELSYHPSKAQPRICLRTGAGAWPRCRSGGPCSSSATHLPCNPPAGQPRARLRANPAAGFYSSASNIRGVPPSLPMPRNHKGWKRAPSSDPALPGQGSPGCSHWLAEPP